MVKTDGLRASLNTGPADLAIDGDRPRPSCFAATVGDRPDLTRLSAAAILSASRGRRPGCLPRARAAAIPSFVRSAIRRRSKCAIAPKTWKINSPAAELVSILILQTEQGYNSVLEHRDRGQQFGERAAKTVETHDRESIAFARISEQCLQVRPLDSPAGTDIAEDLDRPGFGQPHDLAGDVLIAGRHPCIAMARPCRLPTARFCGHPLSGGSWSLFSVQEIRPAYLSVQIKGEPISGAALALAILGVGSRHETWCDRGRVLTIGTPGLLRKSIPQWGREVRRPKPSQLDQNSPLRRYQGRSSISARRKSRRTCNSMVGAHNLILSTSSCVSRSLVRS